ncbi:hypothetical protein [Celerinatantimonas sp. MCCC 1A17872]|uniref:hypothetical protein n=1 Tax=Celerinatantimonas sp. MCCC 1A17872 TaxID=3177514 RepID=UPI0038C89254
MAFLVDNLYSFCQQEIKNFIKAHPSETFYAFAIDANLLCFNSEEQFQKTLAQYHAVWQRKARMISSWDDLSEQDLKDVEHLLGIYEKYQGLDRTDTKQCLAIINKQREKLQGQENPYNSQAEIESLKANTGDWAYQGFSEMAEQDGFDFELYDVHYELDEQDQSSSDYANAMDELIKRLTASDTFAGLKTTTDFSIHRVEHDD